MLTRATKHGFFWQRRVAVGAAFLAFLGNTLFYVFVQSGIMQASQTLQNQITMELMIRKIGNSTGLTFPSALVRDLGLAVGQMMSLKQTEDGSLMLRVKPTRKKYTAKELNALCDFNAPMPPDLVAWDSVEPVGNEAL